MTSSDLGLLKEFILQTGLSDRVKETNEDGKIIIEFDEGPDGYMGFTAIFQFDLEGKYITYGLGE